MFAVSLAFSAAAFHAQGASLEDISFLVSNFLKTMYVFIYRHIPIWCIPFQPHNTETVDKGQGVFTNSTPTPLSITLLQFY